MKPLANYHRPIPASTPHGWLPARTTAPQAPVMHFLSRAARGHTWNSNGAERRRPN